MRVLVTFERSGIVRDAFAEQGHDAWSCDLAPTQRPGQHMQCDAFEAIASREWDLMIAHPPCTYLCSSGLHWNGRRPGRADLTEAALDVVRRLLAAPVPKIGIENPHGRIGTAIRPADQTIQPWQFGDDASKATGLWLVGLPLLVPDVAPHPGRMAIDPRTGKTVRRWANQTDSGQNRLGPSPDRAVLRAQTYPGIARAMAQQWGSTPDSANARQLEMRA